MSEDQLQVVVGVDLLRKAAAKAVSSCKNFQFLQKNVLAKDLYF